MTLACAGLLLGACGTAAEREPSTSTPSSTTTVATTTTTPTTTTTERATTTTQAQSSEVASLMSTLRESSAELTSGRVEGTIEMTGMDEATAGVPEISFFFSTAFDRATGDASFLMDMSSLAGSIDSAELQNSDEPFAGMAAAFLDEIEFRQIGERVFLKFPFFTAMFGAETEWISMPAEEGGEFTDTFETVPSSPTDVLEAYQGASATLEDLGRETVNGLETTHYVLTLNAEEMDLTQAERQELEDSGLFASGVIPVDIWVSDQGHPVRMILEIDGSGIEAPPGEQFETMTIRYDMLDINGEVVIEAPPASDVTDIEDLESGFLGGFEPEG